MSELLAGLPDCDASDQVRTGTDLTELEPPSKGKKTGECSSENEDGLDDSRSNVDGWPAQPDLRPPSAPPIPTPSDLASWTWIYCSLLKEVSSVKSSSGNEGGLDDRRSKEDGWTTKPPFSPLQRSPDNVLDWSQLESNGSLDREDNQVSSENEDRLLNSRSYDDQLSKPKNTLPVSSTEIGKESNEINGVEGSSEVRRHPSAVQLLSVSSDHSNCLDVDSWMEGRHRTPLPLWFRDMYSQPIHFRAVGTIFGNLKPENVLRTTDRSFCAQLSYIKKNKMDPFLVKSTPEAEDLFSRLLKKNPELRLEAREVILHPFSWRSNVKLRFLRKMNARLLSKYPAPNPDILTKLQSNEPLIFHGNWIDKLDLIFMTYILQRKEKYDFSSVMELVRFMRNKSTHLDELPENIKELVGAGDEDFYNYFAPRFPRLFMKLYGAAFQFYREEEWFEVFLKENFPEYFGSDAL